MRRFITFIDAMYEKSVRIIVLANEIPTKLLQLTEKEKLSPHDEVSGFTDKKYKLVVIFLF
jgi:predicted ATPase